MGSRVDRASGSRRVRKRFEACLQVLEIRELLWRDEFSEPIEEPRSRDEDSNSSAAPMEAMSVIVLPILSFNSLGLSTAASQSPFKPRQATETPVIPAAARKVT